MKKACNVWNLLWFLLLALAIGCGDAADDANRAPVVSVFEAESNIVPPGAQISIQLEVYDLENDPMTFTWGATGGTLVEQASGALWTAPETEQLHYIRVTVSDGENVTTRTLDIHVWRIRPGDYYPLAVGNIWRYRSAEDTIQGESTTEDKDAEDTEITFEIVDTIQIHLKDGTTVDSFVLQKTNAAAALENVVNYSYLGKEFNEKGEVSGIVQHAQNISSGTEDTILFTPFLPLYQFPLITGVKWATNFEVQLPPENLPLGWGIDEFEVLAEETITVPAGTFENVFVVQESFWWGFDLGGGLDFSLDTTVVKKWVAPNVGIIKFTQSQTRDDVTVETVFELESFELVNN